MAVMLSGLGSVFSTGMKARAMFQHATFKGLAAAGGSAAVSNYARRSAMPGVIRGMAIGGGLGALSAANNDRRNGTAGLGTPLHMMWGGATGALKGGLLGGIGGAVFGNKSVMAHEALRQYSRGGF